AEREYGVPAEVIVAIIGVETFYGRNTGSYRVLDALSTLCFDYPPRAPFFCQQLREFLLLAREEQVDPLRLKGSYAGAMGLPQFMPGSFRAYAVDFDGDERIDIWSNPVDAIGSVASYFKRHGWSSGEPVVRRARVGAERGEEGISPGIEPQLSVASYLRRVAGRSGGPVAGRGRVGGGRVEESIGAGMEPQLGVAELRELGWQPAQPLSDELGITAISFEGAQGEGYWLGLPNFY